MSTPPPVSEADADAAIARIAARRAAIDDPNAWRLSDDLVDTLDYLRRYSAGIPSAVAEADILDGLILRVRLWWIGEEAELWLLERARRRGVQPRQLAPVLGLRTRQGLHDRLRLARAKVARLTGVPAARETSADQRKRSADLAWLDAHHAVVREIAGNVLRYADFADEDAAEWLRDVAGSLSQERLTPPTLATLRIAFADLATSPRVRALDPAHPLQQLLNRWSQLVHGTSDADRT